MYTGIFFLIEAIFYLLLLMIIYFRKKVFKSRENKVYSLLIIICFLELVIELILDFVGPLYETIPQVSYFIAKLYCSVLESWITILFCYVLFVTLSMKKKEKYIPWVKSIFTIMIVIFITLNFLLPIYFVYDGNIAYTYGPSVNIIYISSFLYSFIGISTLIWNIKNIKDKRFFPILLFLLLGGICSYIQYKNPGLLLATSVHAFITFLMYFTIENPDTKVLQEMHKAKEISDNANEEKTMFLYNMTGAIRDITRDIDYSADTILDESDNKKVDIEVIKTGARDIKGSTAKFTTMTNEILDISNIDSGSIKIYNDKYNIKLIIKELVQIYKNKCEKKGLNFRTSIASDMPEYLYGDSVGLKKALTILLDNSVAYTENGYIEFNVDIIKKRDIARLIITIEDSGIGMKAEELDKIFNKRKEKEENYNLNNNLYNAKKLITLMNGTIIPSSTYGKGTTMKIVLDQKVYEEESNLNKYESIYDKKKILLVDDSENSEKIFKKIFSNTNVEMEWVKLGKECLDKIRNKEKYDLILLDEEMKPLDGHEVMKKLRAINNFNTGVILLTKTNKYEYDDEYLKEGFTDYLIKPIDKDKLFEKIDKYLK